MYKEKSYKKKDEDAFYPFVCIDILANIGNPDEMQQNAIFDQDLHY